MCRSYSRMCVRADRCFPRSSSRDGWSPTPTPTAKSFRCTQLREEREHGRRGGYQSLRKALKMTPEEVLEQLKASGIRGRGGAGFAMGTKVSFLPKGTMDKYLVGNADESEPGTSKDRQLMTK